MSRSLLILTPAVIGLAVLATPSLFASTDVLPGFDLFQTDPSTTNQDFSGNPIPIDFFGPGSDPFDGRVDCAGVPLPGFSGCPNDDLSTVDTIVERLDLAQLPSPYPSSDQITIEIVALQLRSVAPITVTYNGGLNPELWDVDIGLSLQMPQPTGTMDIVHADVAGGTFSSLLPVVPNFVFTRVSDGEVRELDGAEIGPLVIEFEAIDVPWVHLAPPAESCTSNFCVNPGVVTVEQALFAAHGVLAVCPEDPTQTGYSTWGELKSIYR
jgi:hypothetical protein